MCVTVSSSVRTDRDDFLRAFYLETPGIGLGLAEVETELAERETEGTHACQFQESPSCVAHRLPLLGQDETRNMPEGVLAWRLRAPARFFCEAFLKQGAPQKIFYKTVAPKQKVRKGIRQINDVVQNGTKPYGQPRPLIRPISSIRFNSLRCIVKYIQLVWEWIRRLSSKL